MLAALTICLPAPAARNVPPPAFVAAALCVHSSYLYTSHRVRGRAPEYVLWHHGYWRLGKVAGNGEGGWTAVSDPRYGGGLSFTLGTWNRAGRPYASSTEDIATASPREQIRRAWVVVLGESSAWSEWPNTAHACGLR